ncbi:hypothetical protein BT69DRAFT_1297594 [Atractiella rhizophila]|nr:hypothetical protein BT69DRAFT_1297594 [Atractiella rhizophila]
MIRELKKTDFVEEVEQVGVKVDGNDWDLGDGSDAASTKNNDRHKGNNTRLIGVKSRLCTVAVKTGDGSGTDGIFGHPSRHRHNFDFLTTGGINGRVLPVRQPSPEQTFLCMARNGQKGLPGQYKPNLMWAGCLRAIAGSTKSPFRPAKQA